MYIFSMSRLELYSNSDYIIRTNKISICIGIMFEISSLYNKKSEYIQNLNLPQAYRSSLTCGLKTPDEFAAVTVKLAKKQPDS